VRWKKTRPEPAPFLSQEVLARQWKGTVDFKALSLVAKLDDAERDMRDVLLHALIAERWPKAMPELLKALEALAKARECLRAAPR
jgi:hypothetical protein